MMRLPPIALLIVGCCAACARTDQPQDAIRPTYDDSTGRLTQLAHDSDADGKVDTWVDMDGATPVGARIDRNGDGRIDRWEEYDENGGLARIGFSRSDSGVADAWAVPAAGDGENRVQRVEISSQGDSRRIDRWEYYDTAQGADGQSALIRAEEDTNGDGMPDKWETYEAGMVKTVAFDEDGDGVPDRRLTYESSALVEVETY
jgi:hypothetical protein